MRVFRIGGKVSSVDIYSVFVFLFGYFVFSVYEIKFGIISYFFVFVFSLFLFSVAHVFRLCYLLSIMSLDILCSVSFFKSYL